MKSILSLRFSATFKFSFKKAEIKDGKISMNTYDIKQTFELNSPVELESLIQAIAKKFVVNPSNVDYEIID